ncbi:hypothetical protein EMCRGX_G025900 [Ephydatia muelleri]
MDGYMLRRRLSVWSDKGHIKSGEKQTVLDTLLWSRTYHSEVNCLENESRKNSKYRKIEELVEDDTIAVQIKCVIKKSLVLHRPEKKLVFMLAADGRYGSSCVTLGLGTRLLLPRKA